MARTTIADVLLRTRSEIKRHLPINFAEKDGPFFVNEATYDTFDCYLKFLGQTRFSFDSVVYKNGFIVDETLYSIEHKTYYKFRYLIKKILTCKKVTLDRSTNYFLATDFSSAGHFHWLTEALPRLFCAKDISREFVLLLPDTPYVRKIAIPSLELLGLEYRDIILMKENELYKAENLYFVTKLSRTGQMHDEIMQEINQRFIESKKPGKKKIYISRGKAQFRKIVNEKELITLLRDNGFEILYGEDFSLAEQIDIFSSCQTLLGIHGAGLTNCLFMHPGGNVVELRKNEVNVGYWFLADSLKHNYYYYNGIPDSEQSLIGRGCNLEIPLRDFAGEILQRI